MIVIRDLSADAAARGRLPALYTNMLMQQGYSAAGRYGSLLLYVLASMFDDALMVGIVVATLSRRRLRATEETGFRGPWNDSVQSRSKPFL